jgi:hypothetical protein
MSASDLIASEITVVFGGDTSLGETYLKKLKSKEYVDRLISSPASFFEALEPLITDKFSFIINLETVLANEPETYLAGKRYCGWDAPEMTISAMKTIGIDLVSLANNHTLDFGPHKMVDMISILRGASIDVVGAGSNIEQASKPWKICSPLGNIYIFAAFEFRREYQERFHFYATSDKPGVNYFRLRRLNRLTQAISVVRRSEPDALIIAFPHWGGAINYSPPTKGMWDANDGLLEAGVDLVLGHGSHNVQRCFASLSSTTVFSIGNFVFNSPGRYKLLNALPYSLIGRLTLGRTRNEWTGMLKLYPIVSDNLQTGFRPRPATETEALEVFQFLSIEGKHNFNPEFELQRDERGWHVARTMPFRRKLSGSADVSNY